MKKLLVLMIFSAFIISGCSYYTCPTYAEGPVEAEDNLNIAESHEFTNP